MAPKTYLNSVLHCVGFPLRDFVGCMKLFGSTEISVAQWNKRKAFNAENLNFYRSRIGTYGIENTIQNSINFVVELNFYLGETIDFAFCHWQDIETALVWW